MRLQKGFGLLKLALFGSAVWNPAFVLAGQSLPKGARLTPLMESSGPADPSATNERNGLLAFLSGSSKTRNHPQSENRRF
jgi:hypothetical protein